MNEERFIKLYKKDVSINLRHNEFGDILHTVDTAIPESGESDYKIETEMKSMSYLNTDKRLVTITGTGHKKGCSNRLSVCDS